MSEDFIIRILSQGWLEGSTAEEDLCSHGIVELKIGGIELTAGQEDYGISEAALSLLRTLEGDRIRQPPVPDPLIPCGCGAILMINCCRGIEWSVRYERGRVHLSDAVRYEAASGIPAVELPDAQADLERDEYIKHIVDFAQEAKQPFEGIQKRFSDPDDETMYREFWSEYDALLKKYSRRQT